MKTAILTGNAAIQLTEKNVVAEVLASSGRTSTIRIDRTGQTESIHQPSGAAASAAAPEYE